MVPSLRNLDPIFMVLFVESLLNHCNNPIAFGQNWADPSRKGRLVDESMCGGIFRNLERVGLLQVG